MPKRGSDANTRIFFDELVSIAASRLKATGVIRPEDQHALIPLGSKQTHRRRSHRFQKRRLVVLARLPKSGRRAKKLWLVDGALFLLVVPLSDRTVIL